MLIVNPQPIRPTSPVFALVFMHEPRCEGIEAVVFEITPEQKKLGTQAVAYVFDRNDDGIRLQTPIFQKIVFVAGGSFEDPRISVTLYESAELALQTSADYGMETKFIERGTAILHNWHS